jgi:hypothetical protein
MLAVQRRRECARRLLGRVGRPGGRWSGTDWLIRQVRAAEAADPRGRRWQRSKATDDATVVYCDQLGG